MAIKIGGLIRRIDPWPNLSINLTPCVGKLREKFRRIVLGVRVFCARRIRVIEHAECYMVLV